MMPARRFWSVVTTEARGIQLDGRPLLTPARAPLLLPTDALAHAVAEEWRAAGETIDPAAMPLTGLAHAAIDRVAPDRAGFARGLAAYAETDLLCYRAAAPDGLIARQTAAWDPPLHWAERHYAVGFVVTQGILPVAQPPETIARIDAAVAGYDSFRLAALHPLTTLAGSIILALGVLEGVFDAHAAWAAADIDDSWQAELWGEDSLATAAREARRTAFMAAGQIVALL